MQMEFDMGLKWSLRVIDSQSFYILTDFSNPELVSYYQGYWDNIVVTMLRPEAFQDAYGKPASIPKSTSKK